MRRDRDRDRHRDRDRDDYIKGIGTGDRTGPQSETERGTWTRPRVGKGKRYG